MNTLEDGKIRVRVDVEKVCYNCEFFVPKDKVEKVTVKCQKQAIYWSVHKISQYWIRTNNKSCPHIKKFLILDKLDQI